MVGEWRKVRARRSRRKLNPDTIGGILASTSITIKCMATFPVWSTVPTRSWAGYTFHCMKGRLLPSLASAQTAARQCIRLHRAGSTTMRLVSEPRPGCDTRFIFYWIQSCDFSQIREGSGQPYISDRTLKELVLLLPPLPEQRAIAHILGTLDDKIELNRRMSETLEAMARALFKAWFVDFEPGACQDGGSLAARPVPPRPPRPPLRPLPRPPGGLGAG
jgi:hypothetical protein